MLVHEDGKYEEKEHQNKLNNIKESLLRVYLHDIKEGNKPNYGQKAEEGPERDDVMK